ncbi:PREDICTED: SLAM family member 6 [Condylura cristata]|uniref:SLAM family member 6 n=1 Tax=Condylura cristata TaxID=143302 RepID=UPI00064384BC|nr:PREDICTED: SLAM family member 6 [Condylura cristata]
MVMSCRSDALKVNGFLGESVTFPLNFSAKLNVNTITWLHNGTSMIFMPKEAPPSVTDPERKNRINVTESYSLQLNELKMTDSGLYMAQIATDKTQFYCYTLRIFRRLSNLYITSHTELSTNGSCEVYLTCSVENPDDSVSFGWQESGNTFLKRVNLTVSWNPWNSNEQDSYTCVAENPISNISSSVSLQSLCKETWRNTDYVSFPQGNTVYTTVIHSNRVDYRRPGAG